MRILFVLHSPADPFSAVFADTTRRAEVLRRRGHAVEIWTHEDFPNALRSPSSMHTLIFPRAVSRRLRDEKFDRVVFHSFAGWWYLGFTRRPCPSIVQFHGVEPLYFEAVRQEMRRRGKDLPSKHRLLQQWIMPFYLRLSCLRSNRILCLNHREARYIKERGWAAADKIGLVYNPAPAVSPPMAVNASGVRRIAFLGQWLPAKGTMDLVDVFNHLAQRPNAPQLLCLGTRAGRSVVERGFSAAARERLLVVAEAPRSELLRHLSTSEVFVLPSVSEGSSLALLEAMAAGMAIVATDVGAAPDLLVDGRDALLVAPLSPPDLLRAIERLLEDDDLRAKLARNAQVVAASQSWERIQQDYVRQIELDPAALEGSSRA